MPGTEKFLVVIDDPDPDASAAVIEYLMEAMKQLTPQPDVHNAFAVRVCLEFGFWTYT